MSVLNWSGVLSPSAAWHVPEEPAENLVLDVRDLRMRYGRTDVLNGVTFTARRGEVLALLNSGAYSLAQMFHYNGRPLPAAVMIADGGNAELIRRRDTYDDLIVNDVW